MLAAALQAEVAAYIDQFAGLRDEDGRRMVVRNGTARPRTVLTGAGAVEVTAPRVNDKRADPATGERKRFSSAILPPWARKTPQISEVLPLLYLHGLSSGDFVPALGQFLGSHAGLSASTVTRLTETWSAEAAAFMTRDLSAADYVCLWVDGIHLGIRLGEGKLCLLVMIGVRADGRKELVALADGYRESAESWADLLRDCARRGMRAPVLAIGDGALGFWSAVREVFPQAATQRCWFHKIANVLGRCRSPRTRARRRPWPRSGTPRTRTTPARPSRPSPPPTGRSSPRPPPRSPTTRTSCWRSTTTGPSTGCTCAPPTRYRIDVRHGQAAHQGHQGPRVQGRRPGDGLQADRVRPAPLAHGQRAPPGRSRPRRGDLRQGQARRTTRRSTGTGTRRSRCVKVSDPQAVQLL
jgi:Transposase, Mutator family